MSQMIRSRLVAVAFVCMVAVMGLVLMSTSIASAQTPTIPTTGEAPAGSGGTSKLAFQGDLKKFACDSPTGANCRIDPHTGLYYRVDATDYDDDPAGNPGSSTFYVSPNLDDAPLLHVWKVLFIDFGGTNDVQAIEKDLKWCAADGAITGQPGRQDLPLAAGTCRTVWHEDVDTSTTELRNKEILIGAACSAWLGAAGTANTPADGLAVTGQIPTTTLQTLINRCIQREVGVHPNNLTISKHLPPGTYQQCITLLYLSGANSVEECKAIVINPTSGFKIDFGTGITWNGLRKDANSVASGDWDFTTPGQPSIEGTGNTSLVLSGRFSRLTNAMVATDPNDDKFIDNDFDVQINRRNNAAGPPFTLVEFDRRDGIPASATNNWTLSGPAVAIGGRLATNFAVCLEPNEILKLDFSVTPRQPVYAGTYTGTVSLSAAVNLALCAPSLDPGESNMGDSDGPYNNLPSQTP